MNLTDDEVLKFLKGSPILFEDVCMIYPAKLGEIVEEGYGNFQQYLGILTASKPNFSDPEMGQIVNSLTDFQYLLLISQLDPSMSTILKQAFLFFIHEEIKISLDPAQIIVGDPTLEHFITEGNFSNFQTILRRMYFLEQEGEEIIINPDDSPAVIKLKMQMRANREKVRRAKARQAAQSGGELKFSDLIGSITINNCGLNIDNIWNITYYAFQDQLKRMGWRDQFEINNRAALAGAKLKKDQLKHWMRSIANSDNS